MHNFLKKVKPTFAEEHIPTFIELLEWQDEFVFQYKNKKYEIVYENGLSLFLSDNNKGTLIETFKDKNELLENGYIEGEKVSTIIDKIIIK